MQGNVAHGQPSALAATGVLGVTGTGFTLANSGCGGCIRPGFEGCTNTTRPGPKSAPLPGGLSPELVPVTHSAAWNTTPHGPAAGVGPAVSVPTYINPAATANIIGADCTAQPGATTVAGAATSNNQMHLRQCGRAPWLPTCRQLDSSVSRPASCGRCRCGQECQRRAGPRGCANQESALQSSRDGPGLRPL